MALDDILFSDGDKQNFIAEIPQDILNFPDDIVFFDCILQFVLERGPGTLSAPLDLVTGGMSAKDSMFYNLTLQAGGGVSYFAF